MFKYLSKRAAPLLPATERLERRLGDPATNSPHAPCAITHCFSTEESNQLRELASDQDATVNGLLARDLLVSIRDWQDHRGIQRRGACLRLMIPINLRTFADRRLSAANQVSMVYLDRNDKQLKNPAELLWGINFEIKTIQRLGLADTCLKMLRVMSWIPGMTERNIRNPVCRSTCIFTNLGEPFARSPLTVNEQGHLQLGDTTIESVDLLAPLRPLTAAAFSIFRYADKTCVTLHYDKLMLSPPQAESLLRRYINTVGQSLARQQRKAQVSS